MADRYNGKNLILRTMWSWRPTTCANLTFGGVLRNRLYMCASTFDYALYVNTQGAAVS